MAVVEKDYKGGCETLNLNGSLSSGALSLLVKTTPSGNWPTGSTLPFVITVDRTTANEEVILCSARTGANFTITTRGYAGSAAVSHGDNATIEHTTDAIALADMMHAAAQTTGKVTTAEDILVATASGTFKRVAKGADGTFLRVSAGAVGYGIIPDGSISSSTMFASGVVGSTQLAASSVVAGKIAAGGVSAANQIANNIITASQVANATLTDTQIASANKDGAAGTASLRTLGTGASQAAPGTDSRFTDSRTPTDATVTQAKMASGYRAVYQSAAASAPSSPNVGDVWEQTDTFKVLHYQGATTGWTAPWNTAWGLFDYVTNTAGQSSINTQVDLTGLTSTQTYVANRRIKITGLLPQADAASVAVVWVLYIMEGGTQLARVQVTSPATNQPIAPVAIVVITPSAGSHTYKLQGLTGAAGGRFTASSTQPAFILIEDIGPNGSPA